MQVIGIGSQDNFEYAQEFLDHTGVDTAADLTMLWEASGTAWRLNGVTRNSSIQLLTHDLTEMSSVLSFDDDGREAVLASALIEPWALVTTSP